MKRNGPAPMLQIRSWHSTTDTPPVIVVSTGAADRPRVRRTLSQAGFAITALTSVEDYLRSRPTTDAHCIVCDPAVEGLALQTAAATVESTTAIIFVTSNADPRMALRALKGGAVDYLIEPFKGPELVSAVRRGFNQLSTMRAKFSELAELQTRLASLSMREREVMAGLSAGLQAKQIAGELHVCVHTVRVHGSRAAKKMGARSIVELARMSDRLAINANKQPISEEAEVSSSSPREAPP